MKKNNKMGKFIDIRYKVPGKSFQSGFVSNPTTTTFLEEPRKQQPAGEYFHVSTTEGYRWIHESQIQFTSGMPEHTVGRRLSGSDSEPETKAKSPKPKPKKKTIVSQPEPSILDEVIEIKKTPKKRTRKKTTTENNKAPQKTAPAQQPKPETKKTSRKRPKRKVKQDPSNTEWMDVLGASLMAGRVRDIPEGVEVFDQNNKTIYSGCPVTLEDIFYDGDN